MEHRAEERLPFKGPNRSWAGTIRCSCGWEGEVADHRDESSAVVGARAMWILHCFDVTVPVHAAPVAARDHVASEALGG
jgi:hypothetical protein